MASPRNWFISTVLSNTALCREHYRLTIGLPQFPPTEPGQFVQVSCATELNDEDLQRQVDWSADVMPRLSGAELLDRAAILRRPFSLAGRRDLSDRVELDIIHRVVGAGTEWLSQLRVGESVHLLGPLGNRFPLPAPDQPALLVGGGVGIPPMLYLAARLNSRPAVAFCGALTRDLLPFTLNESDTPDDATPRNSIAEFAEHGIPSVVSTDDGSFGFRGFVTQALEQYLESQAEQRGAAPPPIIYTCGPEGMMKRVAEIAARRGLQCQIAVERAMACGMGTCQSCVIRVKDRRDATDTSSWSYRLACTAGPVFDADELLW